MKNNETIIREKIKYIRKSHFWGEEEERALKVDTLSKKL